MSDANYTEDDDSSIGTNLDSNQQSHANKSGGNNSSNIVLVSDVLPEKLVIIPFKLRPIFPDITVPLMFSGKKFIEAVQYAQEKNDGIMGIVYIEEVNDTDFFESKLYRVGTSVRILKIIQTDEENIQLLVQGIRKFRYIKSLGKVPVLRWEVHYSYDIPNVSNEEMKPYMLSIVSSLKHLIKINPIFQEQVKFVMSRFDFKEPFKMLDFVTIILTSEPKELQEVLEIDDLIKKSEKILLLLKEEIELFELQGKIEQQINEKVNKQQKEYFLREQLKAIKKELGLEKDDKGAEIEKIEEKLKNLVLTEEAAGVVKDELEKLRMIESSSPEYHVTRNYLNEIVSLPWGIFTKDNSNIKKAKSVLDRDHYGLSDVKARILQFISTIIKKGTVSGSIICLVGPPGVGKTSIGRSIADSLNRKFYRFSVGGMRDEAEIKGHRRTYIGAMPGKLLQSLKRTQSSNPVIMLDEIDKIGNSYQGDPASALLEVLDTEQNKNFLDHYVDVRFDLSNVLFITTANQLDTIPRPLLDRMEVIQLSGYILEEKVEIAKRFLIPKQLDEHGLKPREVVFTDSSLKKIADRYAREAGVRGLENQIKKILRSVTLIQAEKKKERFRISDGNLESFLGKPKYMTELLYERVVPGVVLGLAWTALGGTTLYIEAVAIKTKSAGFKQTGQLGSVMQESSQIALSFVRSLASSSTYRNIISESFFDDNLIHLHVPEGATPKDGPSAGITMALALFSLASKKAITKRIAMTGEITLTGKVLPIGGVREKIIAARRVSVMEVILPKENRKDFDELPDYIKKGVKVHFVDFFEDVLNVAYGEDFEKRVEL